MQINPWRKKSSNFLLDRTHTGRWPTQNGDWYVIHVLLFFVLTNNSHFIVGHCWNELLWDLGWPTSDGHPWQPKTRIARQVFDYPLITISSQSAHPLVLKITSSTHDTTNLPVRPTNFILNYWMTLTRKTRDWFSTTHYSQCHSGAILSASIIPPHFVQNCQWQDDPVTYHRCRKLITSTFANCMTLEVLSQTTTTSNCPNFHWQHVCILMNVALIL